MPSTTQPLFIGLVPDGNRRWSAREHGVPKEQLSADQLYAAYARGGQVMRRIAERAREEMISICAVFGGSVANLSKRPFQELRILHAIYERVLEELKSDWMDVPGNEETRFVHMGRTTALREHAPRIYQLIAEISEHTRERTGMVFAFCIDYSGIDELSRAHCCPVQQQLPVSDADAWKRHLDLPRQGIPFQPVDLIIRTGAQAGPIVHDNEFLHPYRDETRFMPHTLLWPEYTADAFSEDIALFRSMKQTRGA